MRPMLAEAGKALLWASSELWLWQEQAAHKIVKSTVPPPALPKELLEAATNALAIC